MTIILNDRTSCFETPVIQTILYLGLTSSLTSDLKTGFGVGLRIGFGVDFASGFVLLGIDCPCGTICTNNSFFCAKPSSLLAPPRKLSSSPHSVTCVQPRQTPLLAFASRSNLPLLRPPKYTPTTTQHSEPARKVIYLKK